MRSTLLLCLALVAVLTGSAQAQAVVNPEPPTVTTGVASAPTTSTATVAATVDPNRAATTTQIEYGTTPSYGLIAAGPAVPAGDAAVAITVDLTKLTAATTYHFRVVATNAAGTTRGADRILRTAAAPAAPALPALGVKDVAPDAATLTGRVDPNQLATTYAFDYGAGTSLALATPPAPAGAGDAAVAVEFRIAGLQPNTVYSYRLRAANAKGQTVSARKTFRTAKQPLGLALRASASVVRYGRTITLVGTVSGTDRKGVPVVVQRRAFPFTTDFYSFGSTVLANADGVVSVIVAPFTTASEFRLVAPTRGGLVSGVATVAVRAAVRLRARALAGGRVALSGTVAPGTAAGLVALQRRTAPGRYALVRRLALHPVAAGNARFAVTIRRRAASGVYRVATRLTTGELQDGRSAVIRLAGRR